VVADSLGKLGGFVVGPVQQVPAEGAGAGTVLDEVEDGRPAESYPDLGGQPAE